MKIIKNIIKELKYWPTKLAIISFLVLLTISSFLTYRIYKIEYSKELLQVKEETSDVKNQLESMINNSLNVVKIIAFITEKNLDETDFESISKSLLEKNKYIDATQIVKDHTIYKTFPLKGNESTIGYNINADSLNKKILFEAIKQEKVFFEGPIKLIQGGEGIIGRQPIFKNNKFWGFAAVIVRTDNFLKTINLNNSGSSTLFDYQIVQKNNDLNEAKFFKNNTDFSTGIINKSYLPSGNWYLYVKLKEPQYLNKAIEFFISSILLSLIISIYLRKLSQEPIKLEALIKKKTSDLEKANKQLQTRAKELGEANKELEHFAYIISHDLQEPLRMITSFLTQIEKKYNDVLDEKGKKYIFFAVDGAKRMKKIILDILEFSRAGKYIDEKESIDLNDIMKEIKGFYENEYPNGKFNYENLPTIVSYRSPIFQIFHNLVSNAFKYSKENLNPEINIKVVNQSKKDITFAVQDNGIGIEKEYLEKIFVLFQRLQSNEEIKGSGIGLAIVKKIVESLNGTIWVESEKDFGSTFYFKIPK
ncbi:MULTISPECIES: ATP-binding protein [unclassified Flavobacterium]|nr:MULTISPECIES: ATP-binding protein [unclassified Flavobacterium]MQP52009.1 GHKL domain-containing protein [Flavobacterium sp. LMO9]MQP61878.1 GHKL domain-containing protein [Flavobacterium sp. LMO6]